MAGGALLAGLIVALVASLVSRKLTGRARWSLVVRWIAGPLVIGWCLYGLLFLASVHAKSGSVRDEFRSLHPTFRLALSSVVLVDSDLVVTDLARQAAEYERIGLPPRERSRHFRQSDGWVHAADIRTLGRPEWRIHLASGAFRLLGFTVLRHSGTQDHLHVSTPFDLGSSQGQ